MSTESTEHDEVWGDDWGDADVVSVAGIADPVALVKAHIVGSDVQPSNVTPAGDRDRGNHIFEEVGALLPPYPPEILVKLWEHSNSLRQNVDAYAVNIDGHGHRFEPVIDLDADDAEERVSDSMYLERLAEAEASGDPAAEDQDGDPYAVPEIEPPTAAEVRERMKLLDRAMRLERARLDSFFEFACLDQSFVALRKETREDKEIMGNGYWEVLRNAGGKIAQFNHVPAFTMRLLPLDKTPVEVSVQVKRAPLTYDTIKAFRRFRRFVQIHEGRKCYFKEFGDPRVISSRTGKVYASPEDLEREEGDQGAAPPPATEILHFRVRSPRSPYGVPRWIGNLLAVLGSRQAEEVNFLYFENKGVPPLALLVSGGHLAKDATKKIEDFVENRLKGRQNFHKILIVQAIPAKGAALDANDASRTRIEIVPLMQAQQSDALFQNYDERNIDKVGMSFRLPRLLRGDIRDFNRATADAALEFTEMQVFDPERSDFDWFINRKLFPELGIRFWHFRSNAATTRNPIDLAGILEKLVKASILTPGEARELAEGIFNRNFKKLEDLWTRIPPELLKAGILPDDAEPPPGTEPEPEPEPDEDPDAPEPDPDAPEPAEEDEEKAKKKRRTDRDKRTRLGARYAEAVKQRDLRKLARELVQLRSIMLEEEKREAVTAANTTRDADNVEIVELAPEEFAQLVTATPAPEGS